MEATTRPSAPDHDVADLDLADPAGVAHFIRNRLAPLSNALLLARLVAGNDPRISAYLDIADRQAKALAVLADGLHDRG